MAKIETFESPFGSSRQIIGDNPEDRWWVEEDPETWQLFYQPPSPSSDLDDFVLILGHPLQIAKAPKQNTDYAEYWPDLETSIFIVDALNAAENSRPLKNGEYNDANV